MNTFSALTRQIVLPLVLLLLQNTASAQDFWGMTTDGGAYGVGTIFSVDPSGNYVNEFDFLKTEGGLPKGQFMETSGGDIIGVTELGGAFGEGLLFKYLPAVNDIEILHSFQSSTGRFPIRGLTEGANGKLYGTASSGGANGVGVLYEYDLNTNTYDAKVNFNASSTGSTPNGQLLAHSNGIIYGTCWQGGTGGLGTLFSYNPGSSGVTVIHQFSILTGGRPFAGVAQDGNKVVGTAQVGGPTPPTPGVIFQYDLGTSTYSVLYDFMAADGTAPLGGLAVSGGVYYGSTSSNGANSQGTLFSYSSGAGFQVLYDFDLTSGAVPIGRPIVTASGNVVGVTSKGSTNDDGVLYSYNTTSSVYSVLGNLGSINLGAPWGSVYQLANGDLLGMTKDGGDGNSGGVFRYSAQGVLSRDLDFGYTQAGKPLARLTPHSDGLLYGLTNIGGSLGEGTLFSYDAITGVFTQRFNFGGSAFGGFPDCTLRSSNGVLYGTTRFGGFSNSGVVFSFAPSTSTYTKLADLNATLGSEPTGELELAPNGKFYGACRSGGTNGLGTIIEVDPVAGTVTKLHDFDGTNGSIPSGEMLSASNGLIYGVTETGGFSDEGVLYSISQSGLFIQLYDFSAAEGANPSGKLYEVNGLLYGATTTGASIDFAGGIYSWDIGSGLFTSVAAFDASNGDDCRSNLVPDGSGRFMGTCKAGGSGAALGYGTVFRFNPNNSSIALLHDITNILDGIRPTSGLLAFTPTPSSNALLDIKLCLQGAYDGSTMNDALRSLSSFPTQEPYSSLGFSHAGNGGGETINPSVLNTTGSEAIVDWIFVELRDKSAPSNVLSTRAGLLQKDGDIVDVDGVSALAFNMPSDTYHIAVRHRNHFGVMSASVLSVSPGNTTSIDFSNPSTATFGTNAQATVGSATCLWSGNTVPDSDIKYTGSSNDRDPILVKIGGSVPTSTAIDYSTEDVNLDGVIKYTGSNNDRDPILVNIGGNVPTASLQEQLP